MLFTFLDGVDKEVHYDAFRIILYPENGTFNGGKCNTGKEETTRSNYEHCSHSARLWLMRRKRSQKSDYGDHDEHFVIDRRWPAT